MGSLVWGHCVGSLSGAIEWGHCVGSLCWVIGVGSLWRVGQWCGVIVCGVIVCGVIAVGSLNGVTDVGSLVWGH